MFVCTEMTADIDGEVRVYVYVPYDEKEEAKKLGARWDPYVKCWYGKPENKELIELYGVGALNDSRLHEWQERLDSAIKKREERAWGRIGWSIARRG